ncbi:MAG: ABC transporter permease [Bacillota bacterium]|nr:ABC transporter permease [Bacillota bacterium]
MSFFDILGIAFTNLWRRKLRAILTALGMAIGTVSIVVMVSIGVGLTASTEEMIASMGSLTKIEVMTAGYGGSGSGSEAKLDARALESFRAIEHVTAVTPVLQYGGQAKSGRYMGYLQFFGIDMLTAADFDIVPSEGELPQGANSNKPAVLLTSDVAANFYDPNNGNSAVDSEGEPLIDLMTAKIKFSFDWEAFSGVRQSEEPAGAIYDLKVSGVYDNSESWEYYSTAFTDLELLQELLKDNAAYTGYDPKSGEYDTVWLKVDEMDNVEPISAALREQGYNTYSPSDYISTFEEQSRTVQGVLGAIGAVAMVVAAIGIMNTMMMSIYERTREIGVIKVLGCKMRDILTMFIAESAFIGLIGGVVGLLLSYGLSFAINHFIGEATGFASVIPLWLAIGGAGFSALVATLSGLYPSIRAMKLSALAAIRSQ